ncbi:MAG: S8/S53 family peptidase [Archangium sp.]|nr:S8/S53 family peptidase [Archangium sp.]
MRTQLLVLLALTASCGGVPPGSQHPTFTLSAPESLNAAPGASAFLDVSVTPSNETVSLTAKIAPPLTATVEGLRVRIDVPAQTPPGAQQLTLTGTSASGQEQTAQVQLEVLPAAKQAARPVAVHVRLNSLFFAEGEQARVTVDLGGLPVPPVLSDVVLVSSESNDVEKLTLRRLADGTFESIGSVPVKGSSAPGVPQDGTLTLPPGGVFVAFFGMDLTQPGYGGLEVPFVSDFAVLDGVRAGAPASTVVPELMLTEDERTPVAGARPVGTILRRGTGPGTGAPLQLATTELILFHRDQAELTRFLQASQGVLISTEDVEGELPFSSLVEVDPASMTPDRLALVRQLAGDEGELLTSQASAQSIYGLSLAFRLDGFVVAVNPRLQYHSVQRLAEPEASQVTGTMTMRGNFSETASCLPGSTTRACTTDVPALWTYLDLMELDRQRVKVAVLDMGFAPNADFRPNEDGGIDQCDFTGRGARCAAGAALGDPTVGASVVGGLMFHGTGVVTTLGGIPHNGFGSAGVAGQVAVPMLYKYDLASYAFDMGAGVRQALRQGAHVINISAGYPCTIVTSVGPDFDICSEAGRVGLCAAVTLVVHTAAIAFCTSPLVGIPIVGAAVCGGLLTGAVLATEACLSTLAFGNLRSPLSSAVSQAVASGVPVVASAGNQLSPESFPPVVRDYINLGEARTEAWGIIPATIPGVLAIGAAEGAALPNSHFFGERVDVWAPSGSSFISPRVGMPGVTFVDEVGATSGAAPYVAGVIAAMQAANPSLDPARATAAERATAVSRVRSMLISTAFTNATLTARGFANDVRRRNLVDPLGAVLLAAQGHQPDLAALGYDTSLNFSEADGDDDVEARARPVTFGAAVAGTVFAFEGATQDEDWYRFQVPAMAGRVFGTDVELRWLGDEEPSLSSSGPAVPRVSVTTSGLEHVARYQVVRSSGAAVALRVTAPSGLDVPYQLTVSAPVALVPTVTITEPVLTPGQTLCANRPVTFRAQGTYPLSTQTVSAITWTVNGAALASTGLSVSLSRPAGTYPVVASALGGSDSLSVTFVNCTAVAEILTPAMNIQAYGMGLDGVGPYLDISFTGRATDALGNVLDPATLVFEWTTNRGELQPGAPATGPQLLGTGANLGTVRIYDQPGSPGEQHIITLTIRASAGGPVLSTDTVSVIVQWLI